jgi:hypothetical protein
MAKTYNPKRVLFSYRGVPISGFADGTFIKVERASPAFAKTVGADGETARTASADKSGKITVTLMQTSASNDYLTQCLLNDELSNLNTGPAMCKDASGTSLFLAGEAWITAHPAPEFGKEIGTREWVFETGKLEMFEGGNA